MPLLIGNQHVIDQIKAGTDPQAIQRSMSQSCEDFVNAAQAVSFVLNEKGKKGRAGYLLPAASPLHVNFNSE